MFYVFHGEDDFSQRETLADLKAKWGDATFLDLNTTQLEGQGLTLAKLRHACDSVPFLADKRLVIVSGLLGKGNPPFLSDLLAYLPHLPETTRLVFLESRSLPASNPLVKLAEGHEKGYVRAFARPQGASLARWVAQRAKHLGGAIAGQAADMLAANAGNDLHLLANELEKLVTYKNGETIEAVDVALLCPYTAEADIFALVDALGNRDGQTAAQLLQRKAAEGADPFYLFAMMVRQFRLLIQVKELSDEGARPPQIAKALGLHDFPARKLYQQSQNFDLTQLEQIYAHLLEIDVGVKTGQWEMATALELLVAALSPNQAITSAF